MKAVLVIDMLEDFFREGPLAAIRKELTERINTLTSRARSAGVPVIWVRQEFREDLADAFLAMRKKNIKVTIAGTRGCEILAELNRAAGDHEIVKKRYSAFYGTELDGLLSELNVTELVLSGINTHACVRTAAIDAYQRDMDVTIPCDCVASYDIEHHDVTLRYLGWGIAKVVSLDDVERELAP
jgi:nicotinamidase-related amidase